MTIPYYEAALSQRTYPGVGDIDDCWVVATIWAIRRQTHQSRNLPNSDYFRAAAGDPDDGRSDGGTLGEIMQGAHRLYPNVKLIKYAKAYGWSGLEGYLDKGYTASIALRSSALPRTYRYGFSGTHQVAIFKKAGRFYIMNPLQPQGSAPRVIGEADLRHAVYAFARGWVMALLVAPINRGTFSVKGGRTVYLFKRWTRRPNGTWTYTVKKTIKGWSETACPPVEFMAGGKRRKLSLISTGPYAGGYVELTGTRRTFTP